MWPYWILFLIPAFFAVFADRKAVEGGQIRNSFNSPLVFGITLFALSAMIGMRYEVGGDWENYYFYIDGVKGLDFKDIFFRDDPAFQLLNWLSDRFAWSVYGVNLFGGTIFSVGLLVFCRSMKRPWLALTVSVPYLVIAVGMGYSRQAVALGLSMIGLVALSKRSIPWFVFWVVLGATFHKSAIILVPLGAIVGARNKVLTLLAISVATFAAYWILLSNSVDSLYENYVTAEYQSQGAMVRLLMNAVPAAIFLRWRDKFDLSDVEQRIWTTFSLVSIALLGLLLVSPATTAVDRVALYMLPLQILVFSKIPDIAPDKNNVTNGIVFSVLSYYAAVQFVWFNFGDFSFAWLPYRSILLGFS
ncbi:EpsG family protein [Sphingomonas sp.]|uniref:EpsG family protein n=1 Tax=Sphingomonas sp. TaxID=28214 RepID=UPI0025F66A97|nr:EpsG family protein [Sphingomonas sp.]